MAKLSQRAEYDVVLELEVPDDSTVEEQAEAAQEVATTIRIAVERALHEAGTIDLEDERDEVRVALRSYTYRLEPDA